MNANKAIFSATKLGNTELEHRVVLAPLTRLRSSHDGVPTDMMVEYYKQRSSKGGFLITEATFVSRLAGATPRAPGIYNQEQIEAWRKITSAVHEKKATIYMQLWHLGRAAFRKFNPNQEQTVSASAIKIPGDHPAGLIYEEPRALDIDEIKSIVQDFRQAAMNAIEAGFDGVEIHNANGYLLDQFINTSSNKRTDIYGGPIENRSRFTFEIVKAVTEAIGIERTGIRFSPGGSFQGMADENVVDTWSYLTRKLQEEYPKLAYVHFIEHRGSFRDDLLSNTVDSLDPYRQIWKGSFISSGGYSNAIEHSINLAEKTGNLIAYGRSFISNPDLPERLKNGWPLTKYNRSTFYTSDSVGYNDYPNYKPE